MAYTKFIFFVIFFALWQSDVVAQNYVPNGSFEDKTPSCAYFPSKKELIVGGWAYVQELNYHCFNWRAYTNGTPDYFNDCDPLPKVGIPLNYVGYQNAAQGSSYVGLFTYKADEGDFKEYITVNIAELEIGKRYAAYISVSLSDSSRYATDDLGIFLFRDGPTFVPIETTLNFKPQVSYKKYGAVTDTAQWTRLAGTIIADSAYNRILIGGFTPLASLILTEVNPAGKNNAYYYVDSVVVTPCKSLRNVLVPPTTCAGHVNIPYKIHDCDLDTANVYTVELSSYTGTFDYPLIFPTKTICTYKSAVSDTFRCHIPEASFYSKDYRLRVTSTYPVDTFFTEPFTIYPQPTAGASNTGPACEGEGMQIIAGGLGTSYTWTGPNGFSLQKVDTIIFNTKLNLSGRYFVTVNYNGCKDTASTEVIIKPMPEVPMVSVSKPACEGQELLLDVLNAEFGTVYLWTGPDSFASNDIHVIIPNVQPSVAGKYRVTADKNGCGTLKDTSVVVRQVYVPDIVSNSPLIAGQDLVLEITNPKSGAGYEWKGPDNFFSLSQTASVSQIKTQGAGIYFVTASFDGCKATTSTNVEVIIPKDTGKILLYPNPSTGNFTVEGYLRTDDKVPFRISNAQGQEVYTGSLESTNKLLKSEIKIPAIADGIYFLSLWMEGKERIFRIVVKH